MYCLDALPMCLSLLVMAIGHPGRTLVGPDSEFPHLTRKEKKAAKAAAKMDKLEKKLNGSSPSFDSNSFVVQTYRERSDMV